MLAGLLAVAGAWASATFVRSGLLATLAAVGVGVLSSLMGAALVALIGGDLFTDREIVVRAVSGILPYTFLAIALTLLLRWHRGRAHANQETGSDPKTELVSGPDFSGRGPTDILRGLAHARLSARTCLSVAAVSILITLFFPPFLVEFNGATIGLGWGFLFDGPKYQGRIDGVVNVPLLVAEWVAIVLVTGIGWLYAKLPNDRTMRPDDR